MFSFEQLSSIVEEVKDEEYPEAPAISDRTFRLPLTDNQLTNELVMHMLNNLMANILPTKDFVIDLLNRIIDYNKGLSNVVAVNHEPDTQLKCNEASRVVVVGDLHGQFKDLLTIVLNEKVGGMPSPRNAYIFNGDLVDRGDMSVETLLTVFLLQLVHKDSVTVLRGNHETTILNTGYGFQKEVIAKYNFMVLELFRKAFRHLPFAAVVHGSVFVTHGGLGPKSYSKTIAELNMLDRVVEPERASLIWELLWCGKYTVSMYRVNILASSFLHHFLPVLSI